MEDSIYDTNYCDAMPATSMNAKWPSSGDHPKMSTCVSDDPSSDESPPSDMENEACGSTPELHSSRQECERMSGEYLGESVYATSSQGAPPAPADISISSFNSTIPTRGYAWLASLSNRWQQSGRKLNLSRESLTDVARGTDCPGVHQFDTIRDAGHEYDTPRGEKCRHKLLGPEERMVPSRGLQEVNTRSDDRLVPQGRSHITDSITTLQSLEADRYLTITLRETSLYNESLSPNIGAHCDFSERPVKWPIVLQRRMVDKAVQTDPWVGGEDEYADDILQLVETSAGVIAPDGFQKAERVASAACEGIDLPSPACKWNDVKLPPRESAHASYKRMRLRLGLSKRARPRSLHPSRHTILNGL